MSEFAVAKSPEVLAVEINAIKQQAQQMMLQASAEIGKRLIEAKEQVEHGEWGKWLQDHVEYSQSTANRLMQIYNEYGTNSAALHNLSYSKAIALLGMEPEEREAFIQNNDVENMSSRELQKLVKEKQQLEKMLEKQEKASEKAEREKERLERGMAELEAQLEEVINSRKYETVSEKLELERLSKELEASRIRAEKLEADLKAKPLEATTATVTEEVVPDEVKEELEQLRQKEAAYAQEIQALKEQLAQQAEQSPEDIFKGHFKNVLEEFKATIDAFNNITSEDTRQKFSKSLTALVDKMKTSVDGVNA